MVSYSATAHPYLNLNALYQFAVASNNTGLLRQTVHLIHQLIYLQISRIDLALEIGLFVVNPRTKSFSLVWPLAIQLRLQAVWNELLRDFLFLDN